ncbi:DUF6240 domain-containing protein [Anaeromicropila populeti]|uniref:Uncharacterized protein n=1 Tax=Anaeromicropila populeti TaxID=37658 RepID=A0A1I6LCP9_9FIRM|nr:DUF6240 domain-containing protein [Anaeromicropila populeti]SFS01251.1 hypothetical protein SAMN05661086_03218 [Anaeromicropila populeti]
MNINTVNAYQKSETGQVRMADIAIEAEDRKVLKSEDSIVSCVSNGVISTKVDSSRTIIRKPGEETEQEQGEEFYELFKSIDTRMTEEDAAELEEEGMSLEKYEMKRLERALTRIKEGRQNREEGIEREMEGRKEYREDIKKMVIHEAADSISEKQLIDVLENANVPLSEENISRIVQGVEMSQSTLSLNDSTIKYLVQNELELTIGNVYQAEHSGASQQYTINNAEKAYGKNQGTKQQNNADWEAIVPQVEALLKKTGMEASEDNMTQCKWLFLNNLPVTEESLYSLNELSAVQQNFDTGRVLQRVVNNFELGIPPEDTELTFLAEDSNQKVQDFLQDISEKLSQSEMGIEEVSTRRQMEEIRLMMTATVGQKLIDKGIPVDMNHLENIVEGLKEIENQYYKGLLEEGSVEATEDVIGLLEETTQKVQLLQQAPAYILGSTFAFRAVQSIQSLNEESQKMQSDTLKAVTSYETLMTTPRKDLGDSIKKAFENIDSILKDMNLEDSEANKRAVRILGYNNIEINEETIMEMKAYDSKVNFMLSNLKPAVAVEMIRQEMNPLDTPLDQLNEKISEIQEQMGETVEEKYSEFLWKLDQKKELTQEERKAYIGIYRLLNQVEKSDGAAIGSVLKAGQDVTLQNLLTAVRTKKSGGIDQSVDENFGEIVDVNRERESISEQLSYYTNLLSSTIDATTPDALEQIFNLASEEDDSQSQMLSYSLEKFGELIQEAEAGLEEGDLQSSAYLKEKIAFYKEHISDSESLIKYLEMNNQPVTYENLAAANELLYNGRKFWREVKDREVAGDKERISEEAQNLFDALGTDQFPKSCQEFERTTSQVLKEEVETQELTMDVMQTFRMMGSSLKLAGKLAANEEYHIPLFLENTVSAIHLTIKHQAGKQGKVEINVDSDKLGKVKAELDVKDSFLTGFVMVDSSSALGQLKEQKQEMINKMSELGLTIRQFEVGMDKSFKNGYTGVMTGYNRLKGNQPEEGSLNEKVSTQSLYQAAKVFVEAIKQVELEG